MEYPLISPRNGAELHPAGDHLLTDGQTTWPIIDDIPYLRDKETVRAAAVAALEADDVTAARRILLADQDRFCPTPAPTGEAIDRVVKHANLTLRAAMEGLNYGPVGDYFAYRWCSPTFTGGLHMLERTPEHRTVIDVACGIGHYLRALESVGHSVVGVDIVWSKLWLARRYLAIKGLLVCGDIEAGPLLRTRDAHTVFCHDAFYFFERKAEALTNMRQLSAGGSVAVGHVHTGGSAHEAGFAQDKAAYAALTDAFVRDDADYILAWYGQSLTAGESTPVAVGWIERETDHRPIDWAGAAVKLQPNPLLGEDSINWPSEGWANEYAEDSQHLHGLALPDLLGTPAPTDATERYRRRYRINLPAQW